MFLFHDREDPPGWVPVQWFKPKILTDFHTSDYVCLRAFCYQFTAIDEASLGTGPCVRPYSQRCHPHREERGRQERNLQLCSDRR